jgi:PAS domain S-box-containing protein
MCYEVLNRKEKCLDCPFEEVVENKQMISRERYIPELNTFMDVCYNPVLDDDGNILFIVERLRDITEKKFLDKILKDSKEKYKQILNNSPDAILIIVDNKIVLANYEACNLLRADYSQIIDSNVYKHFPDKYMKSLHKRFRNVIAQKRVKDTDDYEFVFNNNKKANLEVSFTYMTYDGSSAILAILRDITEMKQELNSAAKLQRKTLQSKFPCEEYVDVVSVYTPAHMISGDFYRIQKIGETSVLGILIDVRGKGISAALNISALDVLFLQEISASFEPTDIVHSLNKKLVSYYEENYIAVCCFSMDFKKKELKVVGAGINRFIFQKKDNIVEEKIVSGPFLGMFEDSDFSEDVITFDSGDKIFFVSDGLDFIFDEDKIVQGYMESVSISQFKAYIDEFLEDTRLDLGKL